MDQELNFRGQEIEVELEAIFSFAGNASDKPKQVAKNLNADPGAVRKATERLVTLGVLSKIAIDLYLHTCTKTPSRLYNINPQSTPRRKTMIAIAMRN